MEENTGSASPQLEASAICRDARDWKPRLRQWKGLETWTHWLCRSIQSWGLVHGHFLSLHLRSAGGRERRRPRLKDLVSPLGPGSARVGGLALLPSSWRSPLRICLPLGPHTHGKGKENHPAIQERQMSPKAESEGANFMKCGQLVLQVSRARDFFLSGKAKTHWDRSSEGVGMGAGMTLPPEDVWQGLGTLWEEEWRPRRLINVLQAIEWLPQQRTL